MKSLKKFLAVLFLAGVIGFSGANAYAQQVGVVDLDNVINNYAKAQDVSADLKVKEAELQKFLADAQKQLKQAKTPVEKKSLEDKLSTEFKTKTENFRETQVQQWKQIEDSVFAAIKSIAAKNKLDIIVTKSSVLLGGTDITDQVLSMLNKK